MNVYVAMLNDRHTDPDAEVFATAEAAIAQARHWAREGNRHPQDYEETSVQGWLFYATYSVEGDSVWVLEKELKGNGHG